MSSGRSLPCTRTRGALLVERCRSLPDISSIFFRSSLSVMPAIFLSSLQHGLAQYFFHGGQPGGHLLQAASPERDHSLLQRFFLDLQRRGADENQFAKFVVDFHYLVKAHAALIAGVVARRAALAVLHRGFRCLVLREPRLNQCGGLNLQRFLALRANSPNQPLRA